MNKPEVSCLVMMMQGLSQSLKCVIFLALDKISMVQLIVYLSAYTAITKTIDWVGGLHNRHLLLIVLESGKFKISMTAWLGSW